MIPGFENVYEQLDALTVRGDLISRKAAIEAIKKDMYADKDYMSAIICEGIENVLNSLPTVEPDRKSGKWEITEAFPHIVYCGVCHKRYAQTQWQVWEDGSLSRRYCPNCGAKMEGEA